LLPALPLLVGEGWGEGSTTFWLHFVEALLANVAIERAEDPAAGKNFAALVPNPRPGRRRAVPQRCGKKIVRSLAFARKATSLERVA
jgi:hypothetical protein